jgi:spore maturation protein CgeB
MKVLYVDALKAPNGIANVTGMTKAYGKVAKVCTFDYRSLARRHGRNRMNESLVQVAIEFKPDFVHLGKCESVQGGTIVAIKKALPKVKVIHFYGDFRLRVVSWVVNIGRACDRTVMQIDGGPLVKAYETAGCHNIGYWPAGTDPEIYGPRKAKTRNLSIVFMGQLGSPQVFPWYTGRRELVEALAERYRVNVFGEGWDKVEHRQVSHHRYVGSEGFSKACSQAEIALGYGAADVPGYTSWPRVLNSMVCGVFFLTRYFPGLEKIFERSVHLDWFESIPEAVDKVEYYQSHPGERDRIGQQGRQEVLKNHTWDERIGRMLKFAGFS